jgi:hypothetical protein
MLVWKTKYGRLKEVLKMAEESLEEQVKQLKKQVERLEAYNEIQNLVAKYEVIHTPLTEHQSAELFALKQPDVSVEIAMWGKTVGPENIKRTWPKRVDPESGGETTMAGGMFEHDLTTPVIQVAKDGQTAKGLWFSPGHETMRDEAGKLVAHWCWGKFAADFIKEDGQWKIWHYHWFDVFRTPYDKSWVEYPQPLHEDIPGLAPTEPTTSRATYFPDQVRGPVPEWPEPYDTWDGKSVC